MRNQGTGVRKPEARKKLAGDEARHERNHRFRAAKKMRPEGGARNMSASRAPVGAQEFAMGGPVVPVASLLSPPANFSRASGSEGTGQLGIREGLGI